MKIVWALVLLLMTGPLSAQNVTTSLTGVVSDPGGQPLPGVTVTLSGENLEGSRTAITDDSGTYRFVGIPPGEYRLRLELEGFSSMAVTATVSIGQASQLDLTFPMPPVPETVTVTADRGAPFTIVRVLYGTNRTPVRDRRTSFNYSGKHSDLSFGWATVSVPRLHDLGAWEQPLPGFEANQRDHVILLTVTPQSRDLFTGELRRRTNGREALVFVHGYNTSFAEAIQRTALLAYDLEFDGTPIAFTWPSRDRLLRYGADEDAASASIRDLEDFLLLVARESGATSIHLIAHSMGNRVLLEALLSLQQRGLAPANLQNLVMAAPDVNVTRFQQLVTVARSLSRRTTLYASNRDRALRLSKWFHDYQRGGQAGQGLFLIDGVDTIDVTKIDTSLLAHSYYAENKSVVSDLYSLIREGEPPGERDCLQPQRRNGLPWWLFQCLAPPP